MDGLYPAYALTGFAKGETFILEEKKICKSVNSKKMSYCTDTHCMLSVCSVLYLCNLVMACCLGDRFNLQELPG